jgi:hypothetical protein
MQNFQASFDAGDPIPFKRLFKHQLFAVVDADSVVTLFQKLDSDIAVELLSAKVGPFLSSQEVLPIALSQPELSERHPFEKWLMELSLPIQCFCDRYPDWDLRQQATIAGVPPGQLAVLKKSQNHSAKLEILVRLGLYAARYRKHAPILFERFLSSISVKSVDDFEERYKNEFGGHDETYHFGTDELAMICDRSKLSISNMRDNGRSIHPGCKLRLGLYLQWRRELSRGDRTLWTVEDGEIQLRC